MSKILVCPVAYNENVKLKNAIERFLKSAVAASVDYLVIDDASTDETTAVIKSYESRGIKTIKHPFRMGVGSAIRTAIKYALDKNYEVLVIMAGNDKDNPEEIPFLIEPVIKEGYDLVQGSRYVNGNRIGGDMPAYRKVATKLHPFLFSLAVRRKVTDSTNGFRAIRLALFQDKRVNIDQEWLNGYELEPYLLFKVISLGHRFKEIPVTKIYPSRKLGYTKMRPIVGWWSILKPIFYLGLGIKK